MKQFTVDDDYEVIENCQVCCCKALTLQPGTTTKVSVGYAPWAVPIGRLHCVPQFQLERKDTCPVPVSSNLPPESLDDLIKFDTPINTEIDELLTVSITDPENDPLTFKPVAFYGPKHGKLVLESDGGFTYTPVANYVGEDRFFVSVTDGFSDPKLFEVQIAVGGYDATNSKATPHISVGSPSVDERYFTVSFPITVSPAVEMCEIWRLTVLQAALDCDCQCFTRSDCFDIRMGKC